MRASNEAVETNTMSTKQQVLHPFLHKAKDARYKMKYLIENWNDLLSKVVKKLAA
jgi:hypothetical protein